MRAAIVGAFYFDAPGARRDWADALARVSHTNLRAVEGARFVAELAALGVAGGPNAAREGLVEAAVSVVTEPSLLTALGHARDLAKCAGSVEVASKELGNTY